MLTVEALMSEDYMAGDNIEEAVYILADGSLWDGGFDYGMRCVEHREAETFSELDRYDGQAFWDDVAVRLSLVMIIPETKEVLIHPEQIVTEAQKGRIREAESRGFEVGELK